MNIEINQVKIGTNYISVRTDPSNSNGKAIVTSYVVDDKIQGDGIFSEVVIGGAPLSISAYMLGLNPSSNLTIDTDILSNVYYALDVIEITEIDNNEITAYDNNTFTYEGNRLSNLRQNNKNYMNIFSLGNAIQASKNTTIQGVPFAIDENSNLIINRSNFAFNDIETTDPSGDSFDIIELMIGGVPLAAGRVEDKYYLIVNVLPNS